MSEKILSLFTDQSQDPTLTDFLGACVAILGIRDSGKSNSAGRLVEQMLSAGVPLTLVDVLGEYYGLKQKFSNIVIVGKSSRVDIELTTTEQAAALAVWSLQERVSVILDVSDHDDDTRLMLLKAYFEALWRTAGQLRRPYQIVLEEAHNWIPQAGMSPVKPIFTRIASEGRSRGLSIIMISQRSARVDKNVLTQAGVMFLHRVQHGTDLDVYQQLVPTSNRKFVKEVVPALQTGECIFVSKVGYSKVKVLKRETFHGGFTPGMDQVAEPTLTSLSSSTLGSLRALLNAKASDDDEDDSKPTSTGVLAAKVKELRDLVDANVSKMEEKDLMILNQQREINRLKDELEKGQPSLIGVLPQRTNLHAESAPSAPATEWQAERQMKRFTETVEEMQQGTELMHRLVLRHFLENPTLEATLVDLATIVGYRADTLRKNPPTRIIELGLLQRRKVNGFLHYTARGTVLALKEQYPNLDPKVLVNRLLNLR